MDRKEAINQLHAIKADNLNLDDPYTKDNYYALKMAIEALSAEPCEDAISRADAISLFKDDVAAVNELMNLASVTPKQKMGRWIPVSERLPEDRDWNLAVFREKDTGYQCIPRVASYVGHDMWIVIDADSVDMGWISDLECIAWMPLPEPYKAESEDNYGK